MWNEIWDYYGPEAQKRFIAYRMEGQRLGQAFFNSLPGTDAREYMESGLDPFFEDSAEEVFKAFTAVREKSNKGQ